MNNKINARRFAVFLVIFLISAWPMAASLFFSIGVGVMRIMDPGPSYSPGWLLLFPPVAWIFWFKLAAKWMHDQAASRSVVFAGCFCGFLALFPFAFGSLFVAPAIIFACYLCYWHLQFRRSDLNADAKR